MKLNNQQLTNFVEKIKFSTKDKSPYKDQIEYLKTQLDSYLCEHPSDVEIEKIKHAGSWAKGTILKPSANTDLDIDIIFYLKIGQVDEKDLHKINRIIVKLLKEIYPTKKDDDFDENPKTANVVFRTSGLKIDIVPVIECQDYKGYVRQPDSKSFEWYITSIDKQLDFISERKTHNPNYASIVRILKKWKAVKNLSISSFAIELIVAYLDIKKGVISDISEGLLRAWVFLGQKTDPEIYFDTSLIGEIKSTIVQIADPTNKANNVTKYISKKDWDLVRTKANDALETICIANEKRNEVETLNLWKEILGNEFNIAPSQIKNNQIITEINKDTLFQSISADFKIIVRKTELWEMAYCEEILHDIELFFTSNFLSKIYLIMKDCNYLSIRCNKYDINYNLPSNIKDRAGNNDWDNMRGASLTVVLSYTDMWANLQESYKSDFKKKLKISWTKSQEDLTFSHLQRNKNKEFSAPNISIQRTDFK